VKTRIIDPEIFGLSVEQTLAVFKRANKGKGLPEPGAVLILPGGQDFIFQRKMHWKYRTGEHRVSWVWRSRCRDCGALYEFNSPDYASALVRTCPLHRNPGKRYTRPKPEPTPPAPRESPLRDLVMATIDAQSLVRDYSMSLSELVDICVAQVPPCENARRDTRRQTATRALRQIAAMPDAPIAIMGDVVLFYC